MNLEFRELIDNNIILFNELLNFHVTVISNSIEYSRWFDI